MARDKILIYAGSALGIPSGKKRSRFLRQIHTFIKFCNENQLTQRKLDVGNQAQVPISTIVYDTDLNEEGRRLFTAAYDSWSNAIDQEEQDPEDTEALAAALARTRGNMNVRNENPSVRGSKKKCAQKLPKLDGKREYGVLDSDSKDEHVLDSDYDKAGPHVYDKADWHLEGEFPRNLKPQQAYVHIGMFLKWLMESGMLANEYSKAAKDRQIESGAKLLSEWGGALSSDMLTKEGNQFAKYYYSRKYLDDYVDSLAKGLPSEYHVKDSIANYSRVRDRIQSRYKAWRKRQRRQK